MPQRAKKRFLRWAAVWTCILLTVCLSSGCFSTLRAVKEIDITAPQFNAPGSGNMGSAAAVSWKSKKNSGSTTSGGSYTTTTKEATTTTPTTATTTSPTTTTITTPTTITTTRATTTTTTIPTTTTTTPTTTTTTSPGTAAVNGKYIVGYYANWASYSGITPDKLMVSKLTHLNYAFASIDAGGNVVMSDPTNDLKNFTILRNLKAANKGLRTLISVGGWDDSQQFSNVALTATSRAAFAQSCVNFILQNGFDGVDIDWEYPVSGGMYPGRAEDKQNFTYLLQAIRQKLNEQSAKDGKTYLLTIAGAAGSSYLNKIEPQKVAAAVDFIFIMAYDLHGPWDAYADLNAALYDPAEASPQYKLSAADAVSAYLNAGVSASRLVLGMPFYGYRYSVTSSVNNGLYSPFTSAKSISYDAIVSGYLSNSLYRLFYHSTARVPYLFGNSTFLSFDNAQSIAEKVNYAKGRYLAGVGAWELSQDSHGVLLSSAYTALNG